MVEIRQPGKYSYAFSRYLDPIAKVKQGEEVVIHTLDAFEDRIKSEDDLPSKVLGSTSILRPVRFILRAQSRAIPCASRYSALKLIVIMR